MTVWPDYDCRVAARAEKRKRCDIFSAMFPSAVAFYQRQRRGETTVSELHWNRDNDLNCRQHSSGTEQISSQAQLVL